MMLNKYFSKIVTVACFISLQAIGIEKETDSHSDTSTTIDIHQMIQKAEDLFDASLFGEAIAIYKEVLQNLQKGPLSLGTEKPLIDKIETQIRFRLAQALFQIKDYSSAVALLEDQSDHQFLLGVAYRKNGDYSEAIATLKNYLFKEPKDSILHREEALFELGLAFFLNNNLTDAHVTFENVLKYATIPRTKLLANLYLARIDITNNHLDAAENFLKEAHQLLTGNDSYKYEVYYLYGEIHYKKHQFLVATTYFEKALPPENQIHAYWVENTLYYLAMSYLRLAETTNLPVQNQKEYFSKAEKVLVKLVEIKPSDRAWLALGEYYLSRGSILDDDHSYKKAEDIFEKLSPTTNESKNILTLLKAQSHATYTERDALFRQLTQQSYAENPLYAKAWYLRGLNDYREALSLEKMHRAEDAQKMYERAAVSLEKAHQQLDNKEYAALALLLQARCYLPQGTELTILKATTILDPLWENHAELLNALPDPLEAYIIYCHNKASFTKDALSSTISKLQEGLNHFPYSFRRPEALHLLGTLHFKNGNYIAAESTFQSLVKEWPLSTYTPEALFWASQSAEKQQKDRTIVKQYRQQIIDQFPSSPLAPEAYFSLFSYQEYLQGDRTAIKHLNAFPSIYPKHPLTLNALFLIGLDNKRDRRSSEGKWIRKKNLSSSIDAFQNLETLFESIYTEGLIPSDKMEHYLLLLYRANLERGLSNYLLSNDSSGAKKQIYLEFAQETLTQLLQKLETEENPYKKWMTNSEAFWHLQEETAYWLAHVLLTAKETVKVEELLSKMLDKYRSAKITRGYFLSKVWSMQGSIAMEKKEYTKALDCLLRAEDASKGKILTTDQRLELWIQQSQCHKEMKNYDKALLLLSQVVNDDAVSSLRIKAMLLRAEIYEQQERFELARKQLEATSKKGGEWALKAKEKLEKEYGYK